MEDEVQVFGNWTHFEDQYYENDGCIHILSESPKNATVRISLKPRRILNVDSDRNVSQLKVIFVLIETPTY